MAGFQHQGLDRTAVQNNAYLRTVSKLLQGKSANAHSKWQIVPTIFCHTLIIATTGKHNFGPFQHVFVNVWKNFRYEFHDLMTSLVPKDKDTVMIQYVIRDTVTEFKTDCSTKSMVIFVSCSVHFAIQTLLINERPGSDAACPRVNLPTDNLLRHFALNDAVTVKCTEIEI